MRSSTPTLTESLAGYWSSARYDDLPPETVRLAKRFLIDTLAAGIAGAGTEVTSIVLDALGAAASTSAGGFEHRVGTQRAAAGARRPRSSTARPRTRSSSTTSADAATRARW